jgi:hypothetical protein
MVAPDFGGGFAANNVHRSPPVDKMRGVREKFSENP